MNQHLTQWDVIKGGADRSHRGISEDQLANERVARETLDAAVEQMWRAIHAVNVGSTVVSINVDAFAAFIRDELPTERFWDEKISEARNV